MANTGTKVSSFHFLKTALLQYNKTDEINNWRLDGKTDHAVTIDFRYRQPNLKNNLITKNKF